MDPKINCGDYGYDTSAYTTYYELLLTVVLEPMLVYILVRLYTVMKRTTLITIVWLLFVTNLCNLMWIYAQNQNCKEANAYVASKGDYDLTMYKVTAQLICISQTVTSICFTLALWKYVQVFRKIYKNLLVCYFGLQLEHKTDYLNISVITMFVSSFIIATVFYELR